MKDAAVAAERFDATEVPVPPGEFALTVTSVKHYTDRLFKFCLTRLASFRQSDQSAQIRRPHDPSV